MKSLFNSKIWRLSFVSNDSALPSANAKKSKKAQDRVTAHAQPVSLFGMPSPLPVFHKRFDYDDLFDFNGPR